MDKNQRTYVQDEQAYQFEYRSEDGTETAEGVTKLIRILKMQETWPLGRWTFYPVIR